MCKEWWKNRFRLTGEGRRVNLPTEARPAVNFDGQINQQVAEMWRYIDFVAVRGSSVDSYASRMRSACNGEYWVDARNGLFEVMAYLLQDERTTGRAYLNDKGEEINLVKIGGLVIEAGVNW